METKLVLYRRLLFFFGALLIIPSVYLPIWRIDLMAPQYPEGLKLQIYSNKLGGDVKIINGLNHYIGMRELHADDFIEFKILPQILFTLAGLGVIVALFNRGAMYYVYSALFFAFCFLSMADFYRWNYEYGHNLNPEAAIQVPGMAYQPPLIGYKQLLNFGAFSFPDSGGMLLMLGALCILAGTVLFPVWNRFFRE